MKTKQSKRSNRKKDIPRKVGVRQRLKSFFLSVARLTGTALAVPALAFFGWKLYGELLDSPYLEIKTVNIAGAERVGEEEVRGLSGIDTGQNLLAVDTGEARQRLRNHPFVRSVEIRRELPDAVYISLAEREPLVFIRLDELYVMDREGTVFKRYSAVDGLDLPVVTGLTLELMDAEPWIGGGLLELIDFLDGRARFGLDDVSEIHVDRMYGFSLYTLAGGVRVEVGSDGFDEKFLSFDRVVEARKGKLDGIEAVDLTAERGVVVRFRGSGVKAA
ncbi:MAG: FtsQ-type POTRA domain-containing protein [Thermodesulfobacteriota bacterium]